MVERIGQSDDMVGSFHQMHSAGTQLPTIYTLNSVTMKNHPELMVAIQCQSGPKGFYVPYQKYADYHNAVKDV